MKVRWTRASWIWLQVPRITGPKFPETGFYHSVTEDTETL